MLRSPTSGPGEATQPFQNAPLLPSCELCKPKGGGRSLQERVMLANARQVLPRTKRTEGENDHPQVALAPARERNRWVEGSVCGVEDIVSS